MAPRFIPLKDRFDKKWQIDAESGCWVWHGAVHIHGYGKIFVDGQLKPAHRVGWELYVGKIPAAMHLDHKCLRKCCVNPNHLEPVSNVENIRRRNLRGHTYRQLPSLRVPRHKPTLRERFDAKWVKNQESGCWEWVAQINPSGYGSISVHASPTPAHRVAYELYVGKIPEGLHIDHLCRNRCCVNPKHLEPVTNKENGRRGIAAQVNRARHLAKTHCKFGHPLSGDNVLQTKKQRVCLTCRLARKRKYNALLPKSGPNLTGLALGAAASVASRMKNTKCPRGHEYDKTYTNRRLGWTQRTCSICRKI